MIQKLLKNQVFSTTLKYVLSKEEAVIICSNMGGTTTEELSREFAAARRLRPNLKRACLHAIFSLPHHDLVTDDTFGEIVQKWMEGMGFLRSDENNISSDCQYIMVRHSDKEHNHLHLVANRIRMDGSVVSDSWDYRRGEVLVRRLEKEYGLEEITPSWETDRNAITTRQLRHSSSSQPVKLKLQNAIDEVTQDNPTVTQLIARLQQLDINPKPTFSTRGLFREAISFEMEGVTIAGNKLGKAYSFPGLQKFRGVRYDKQYDKPALLAAAEGQVVSLPQDELSLENTTTSPQNSHSQSSTKENNQTDTDESCQLLNLGLELLNLIPPKLIKQTDLNEDYFQLGNYTLLVDNNQSTFSIDHRCRGKILEASFGETTSIQTNSVQTEDIDYFQNSLSEWREYLQLCQEYIQRQQQLSTQLELD